MIDDVSLAVARAVERIADLQSGIRMVPPTVISSHQ
jgi:hypothetical protein